MITGIAVHTLITEMKIFVMKLWWLELNVGLYKGPDQFEARVSRFNILVLIRHEIKRLLRGNCIF